MAGNAAGAAKARAAAQARQQANSAPVARLLEPVAIVPAVADENDSGIMLNQAVGQLALPVGEALSLLTAAIRGRIKGCPAAVRVQAASKVLDLHAASQAGKAAADIPEMSPALYRALALRHAAAQASPGELVAPVPEAIRQDSGSLPADPAE
jgi:hypothetical protein